MYAIVSIAGQQFKVEKNKKVFVHRLQEEEGSVLELDKVMLIDNEDKILVGAPYITNALVTAKVVSHLKGDKVLVLKKKRRKGYQKMNGHRQYLTEILIDEILENGGNRKTTISKKEKKEEPVKAEAVVDTPSETLKPEAEVTQPKAKKPAARKSENSVTKGKAESKKAKAEPKTTAAKKPAAAKKPVAAKKPAATKKTDNPKKNK